MSSTVNDESVGIINISALPIDLYKYTVYAMLSQWLVCFPESERFNWPTGDAD